MRRLAFVVGLLLLAALPCPARAEGKHKLGWKRDQPDARDRLFAVRPEVAANLPPKIDLAAKFPPPYDQGRIGSCTGNAIAGALQYDRRSNGLAPDFMPSRLFVYYWERSAEKSVPYDAGASIRDGIAAIAKYGCPPEPEWPYDDTPPPSEDAPWPPSARARAKPGASVMASAARYKILDYARVQQSVSQFKATMAGGDAIVFGFTVYSSFFDPAGNPRAIVPLPRGLDSVDGGHAVVMVGYDDGRSLVKCRNSWGPHVQSSGYFYLPYAYVGDPHLAADFWVIRGEQNLKRKRPTAAVDGERPAGEAHHVPAGQFEVVQPAVADIFGPRDWQGPYPRVRPDWNVPPSSKAVATPAVRPW
jgi:hypothetical protein